MNEFEQEIFDKLKHSNLGDDLKEDIEYLEEDFNNTKFNNKLALIFIVILMGVVLWLFIKNIFCGCGLIF